MTAGPAQSSVAVDEARRTDSTDGTPLERGTGKAVWAFASAAAIATLVYLLPGTSDQMRAVILVGAYAAATLSVVWGILVHRPERRRSWVAIAGFLGSWTVAWGLWQEHVLRVGATPPADSLIHLAFAPGYLLLAAALGMELLRRERSVAGLVEAGIIAAAVATLSWSFALHEVFDAGRNTAARTFPLVYGFGDVIVGTLLLRLAVRRGFLGQPIRFAVAAACASVLVSDSVWNWLTSDGWYSPGTGADVGWIIGAALFGAAALTPSMASLSTSPPVDAGRASWLVLLLMVTASIVPPADLLLFDAGEDSHSLTVNSIGAALVSILVIARLALVIMDKERLVDMVARQNRRLAGSEDRLRSIFEHSPVGIAVLDLEGRIQRVNQRRLEMLGVDDASGLLGRRLGEFVHPDDRGALERMLNELAAGNLETGKLEKRDISAHGDTIWVSVIASVVRSDVGQPRYIAVMAEDVTQRRRLESEREAVLSAEREQSERLRELDRLKDEFVATVSHELRTPLTSIQGYLELVLSEEAGPLNDDQRRFLATVERNSNRLLRLVGDLLFAAQVEARSFSIEKAPVDLAELAHEVVTTARPFAKSHEVQLQLEPRSVVVKADRARIAQVLDNLISNACKFTAAGGRVDVRVREAEGRAEVEVEDTGVGIGEQELQQLFQRFFRTDDAARNAIQGTGLGLSIARAIAEAHDGDIEVSSTPGEGSTFTLWLPLEEDEWL